MVCEQRQRRIRDLEGKLEAMEGRQELLEGRAEEAAALAAERDLCIEALQSQARPPPFVDLVEVDFRQCSLTRSLAC